MKAYAYTDVGKLRSENQDYVFMSEQKIGNLSNLFLVADGMGGHAGGRYASCRAVEIMLNEIKLKKSKLPIEIFEGAIQEANRVILTEAEEDETMLGMGTTIVAATILDGTLYTANVGDSRLYVQDKEGIRQITKDHSLVEEMLRIGEIDVGDVKEHPDKNVITRAVGAMNELKIDYFETALKKGNMVLLCSDGLSNMIEDSQMSLILSSSDDTVNKAEKLVLIANQNGGKDNITAIVIES